MLHRQRVCKYGVLEPFSKLETKRTKGYDVDEENATFQYLSY